MGGNILALQLKIDLLIITQPNVSESDSDNP